MPLKHRCWHTSPPAKDQLQHLRAQSADYANDRSDIGTTSSNGQPAAPPRPIRRLRQRRGPVGYSRDAAAAWSRQGAACTAKDAHDEDALGGARAALGAIEGAALKAGARANAWETLGRGAFVCRSAPKLAALDAAFHFRKDGFVDACAAPGGFCQYLSAKGSRGAALSLVGCNSDGKGARWEAPADDRVVVVEGDVYEKGRRDALVAAAPPSVVLCLGDGAHDSSSGALDQDSAIARLALAEPAVAVSCLE